MSGFDVIIGMDWLAKYRAKVDCHKKRVEFRIPGGEILKFEGERGIPKKINPMIANIWEGEADRGEVAYELNLLLQFAGVHNVFHISMLRKYVHHPSHIIDFKDMEIQDDISLEEHPIKILDRRDQVLRGR